MVLPSESSWASERGAEMDCYSFCSGTDRGQGLELCLSTTKGMGRSEKGLPKTGRHLRPNPEGREGLPHGWGNEKNGKGGKPRLRNRPCSFQSSDSHLE